MTPDEMMITLIRAQGFGNQRLENTKSSPQTDSFLMQMWHIHSYQITQQVKPIAMEKETWLSDGAAYQIRSQLTIERNISFIWLGIIYPVIPGGKQEDGVPQQKHTKISSRSYRTAFCSRITFY